MSEIFMIRHGQASFGKDNYDKLSDKGILQCKVLGDFLTRTGITFHSVYSGYLERQKETAKILIEKFAETEKPILNNNIKDGFNEYSSSDIIKTYLPIMIKEDPSLSEEMEKFFTDKKSFQRIFDQAMDRWIHDDDPPNNIESRPKFKERVSFALGDVMKESGKSNNILIAASGGSITAAVQFTLGISDEDTMKLGWQIANASITRFRFSGSRITLHSLNEYGHLMENNRDLVTFR